MTDTVVEPKDILDDVVELAENTATLVRTYRGLHLTVVGAVAFAVGAVGATYFTKKRLDKEYEERAQIEREEARKFYGDRARGKTYSSPSEMAADVLTDETAQKDLDTVRDIAASYQSDDISEARIKLADQEPHETETSEVVEGTISEETVNIFRSPPDAGDFNYEEEIAKRTEEAPYVITYDEFQHNESDYEQSTLTYFAGDDTLADSTDQIINETDETVGDDNLLRFGHGSKQHNVVYIRNDRLELEWEVVRSPGRYAKEVLGFDDSEEELQHSYRDRRPRRFRNHDE